jgi:phosphinothricin acetyltransferase
MTDHPSTPEREIRTATEADLPAISDIYNYYVLHSTCTFQIEIETAAERLAWFKAHDNKHPVVVVAEQGVVLGWGSLSKFRDRAAYDHTVEASVYIRHDRLGEGLGRVVLTDLIERAKRSGHHTLIGGATADQTASIALQESLGFRTVGKFHEVGLKFGRLLDVVFTQLMLRE